MSAKIYPWSDWFKRREFTINRTRGKVVGDYDCMPHSMAQQIRTAASRYGKRVSIKFDEDKLTVTVEQVNAKGRKSKSK